MTTTFAPSARQFEMMENAVGGDSRHRNYYVASAEYVAATDDTVRPWRELVAAGLAIEAPHHPDDHLAHALGPLMLTFRVSPAGIALLDARARPRILEAKAAAWDAFVVAAREHLARVASDADDAVEEFIAFVGSAIAGVPAAPEQLGPRAIAEEILSCLTTEFDDHLEQLPGKSTGPRAVDRIAEIIRKAQGGT